MGQFYVEEQGYKKYNNVHEQRDTVIVEGGTGDEFEEFVEMFVEDKQDTVKVKEEPDSNWFRQGVE